LQGERFELSKATKAPANCKSSKKNLKKGFWQSHFFDKSFFQKDFPQAGGIAAIRPLLYIREY